MNRLKVIENKSSYRSKWETKKFNRAKFYKTYKDIETMPFYGKMTSKTYRRGLYVNYQHIDNMLMERIGYDWNDVYSELLSKIRLGKYRYEYDIALNLSISKDVYYVDNLPYKIRRGLQILLSEYLFVDEDNKISYYETEDDLKKEYKKRLRLKKYQSIFDEADIKIDKKPETMFFEL